MKKLMFLGIGLAALAGCVREKPGAKTHLDIGDPMPEFTATGPWGSISKADLAGKRALVVVFRSSCGDCRRELPKIEGAFKAISAADPEVRFVAVSKEAAETVATYWTGSGYAMPYFLDESGGVYDSFEVSNVPTLYLFDSEGKVAFLAVETFTFDEAELIGLVEQLQ